MEDAGNEGTVAFENELVRSSSSKTFMKRVDGWSLCKSMCAPILFRPVHEKIVRERLTEFGLPNSVIRTLRGEIASFGLLGCGRIPRWGLDCVQYCDGKKFPMDVHPTKN